MQIILTEHAKQRILERNIPPIEKLNTKFAGRKVKKKIRELCVKNGCDTWQYIYMFGVVLNIVHVFVCKQIDIGKLLCITAFSYELQNAKT